MCHITFTPLFQIIGRGNDQVAISSKFETREDIGESPMGLLGVGEGPHNGTPASVANTGLPPTLSGPLRVRPALGLFTLGAAPPGTSLSLST